MSVCHFCYSKAACFSCYFCDKVKATLFVPLHWQIFHAVPEHVGFNIELKWICQMKVSIKYRLLCTNMFNKHIVSLCFFFLHRTGHGTANCQPISTWTATSISSCPAFCSKLGKDASSSPASTPTSAQCKSTCMLLWMSALTHWH